MARLDVRLLGVFDVLLGGRTVTGFESTTDRALLARLAAVPGTTLPRPALGELLWPGRPEGRALGNLRHSLAGLRRAIGDGESDHPVLVSSPAGIAFDPEADATVDVVEFRRLAATDPSAAGAVAAWEAAAALRSGPLLDGFEAKLSAEWETWLIAMRATVDAEAAAALGRLAELDERSGTYGRAIDLARRRLELEPWNEQAHRQLMRTMALDDQRAAALVHADTFAAALDEQLGTEPTVDTRILIDDIRSGRFPLRPLGVPGLAARTFGPAISEPCVGRTAEIAWLDRHLDQALTGSGRLVFVTGQAGSGKSVLLRALASEAETRIGGLSVLAGTCNAFTGSGDPYLPFRQILGLLCGDIERAWSQGSLTPSGASQLWAGLPASVEILLDEGPYLLGTMVDVDALCSRFERRFPDGPVAERLRAAVAEAERRAADPMRRQQPLLEQYMRVLTTVARQRPLLITIDDLQWADAGTLELLLHLARQVAGAPILIVAALRSGDVVQNRPLDPLTIVVNEARALSSAESLLQLEGTRDFVDAWLDTEPNLLDEQFRDRLFEATHGHALFTVEMVQAMRERGEIVLDEDDRWSIGAMITWDTLPPRVEATIATRLAQLPDELHHDLEAASAQGTVFTAELVAEARHVPPTDVELRLGGLASPPHLLVEQHGTLRVGERRLSRYRFRHALFQRYLYEHIAASERRVLHEVTGRAIEGLYADRIDDVAVDLAQHFDRAGLIDEAIEYLDLAGRRAMRLSAAAEAIDHFERAIELLDSIEPSTEGDRRAVGLLTSLGTCLQAHSGYNATATTAVYERLRRLIPRIGPTLEAAQALGSLATVDGLRARYAEALAGVEQLLTIARQLDAAPIEAVAHTQAGWMLFMTGRFAEADERLTSALELYQPEWDEWLTYAVGLHVPSTALAWRSLVLWYQGWPDQARRCAEQSIAWARRIDNPFGLTFALSIAGCVLAEHLDQPDDVIAAADEAKALADREAFGFYRAAARLHAGEGRARSGDFDNGLAEMRAGLAGWIELGTDAFLTWIRTALAEMLTRDGRLDAAGEVLDEVEHRLATGEERIAEVALPFVRGLVLRAAGDADRAERQFRRAIEVAVEFGARGPHLRAATALAELLSDHERCSDARAVLEPIVDWFTEGADTPQIVAAQRVLQRCSV